MEQNENTLSVLKIAPGQHPQQVEIEMCIRDRNHTPHQNPGVWIQGWKNSFGSHSQRRTPSRLNGASMFRSEVFSDSSCADAVLYPMFLGR